MSDLSVLEWYLEQGVTDILENEPVNRLALPKTSILEGVSEKPPITFSRKVVDIIEQDMPLGSAEALKEAQRIAAAANTLDELANAIQAFDGLSIKKTAANFVFADGNPKASVMVIGDAPDADDDIQGKPMMGENGQLLDKMLAAIGLSRNAEDVEKSVYITNLANWRPPGNRSLNDLELDVGRVFVEKQVALVQPKLIIVLGGVAAKTLLNSSNTITKLRGKWSIYKTSNDMGGLSVPCMPLFDPAFLIKMPTQKRVAWADLQLIAEKIR